MPKKRRNSWPVLVDELCSRFFNALKSPRFMAFFAIGIVLIGGIGVWLPYYRSNDTKTVLLDSQNVFTYSLAILGTIIIESIIDNKKNNGDLTALGLILGSISLLASLYGYIEHQSGSSLPVNIGAAATLLLFFLANVNDERFDNIADIEEPTSPTGYENPNLKDIEDRN